VLLLLLLALPVSQVPAVTAAAPRGDASGTQRGPEGAGF